MPGPNRNFDEKKKKKKEVETDIETEETAGAGSGENFWDGESYHLEMLGATKNRIEGNNERSKGPHRM